MHNQDENKFNVIKNYAEIRGKWDKWGNNY